MNLQKLFEMQALLDADIEKHHPIQDGEDRLSKKILALLVELGECAQEWRGFKFWSNDQEPRIHVGIPKSYWFEGFLVVPVEPTKSQIYEYRNKLLEEYVDCLHFILSIGNEINITSEFSDLKTELREISHWSTEKIFIEIMSIATALHTRIEDQQNAKIEFVFMLDIFFVLSCRLGFTLEQIEQAYFDKNKINFERQANGY